MPDSIRPSIVPPKVTVCMPVAHDRGWLGAALCSVLRQKFCDIEVVITDDSGGDLRALVDGLADPRIRYVANPQPLGFAGNHCAAIALARGDYVAFMHDDDAWTVGYLDATAAVLDCNPKVGFVLAGAEEVGPADEALGRRPARMAAGLQADPLALFLRKDFMLLLPSLSLFRRSALDANVRPWPDVIAADLTMYVDAVRAGWDAWYLDAPLVRYRTHPTQIGTNYLSHRHALVTVWDGYRFTDSPRHEALRRERLGTALMARAGALLRLGRVREARSDLAAARVTWPSVLGPRFITLYLIAAAPGLAAAAGQLWLRLRDPVATRHRG